MDNPFRDIAQDTFHDTAREASPPAREPEPDAAGRIVVPADIVAHSRPSGHPVRISRGKRRIERSHGLRYILIIGAVIAMTPFVAMGTLIYAAMAQHPGEHLSCTMSGTGKFVHTNCMWRPNGS